MTISVKFCRGLTDIAPDKIIIRGPLNTLKKKKGTYISMNIEPNGRTPPRIMITNGSMNLQHNKYRKVYVVIATRQKD